ncbi:MAG TPA: glycosyltransferase [Marmoricola sp.]|nr:glycosyltransferase [Marmoricola sp.]
MSAQQPAEHVISVVIPVYGGERRLAEVVDELEPYTHVGTTAAGRAFRVGEVILVHDGGRDRSPAVMRRLAEAHPFVRLLWLSRNFGQHAATLAGIAGSAGDWVVTMDEDGQHDPRYIPDMLDVAVAEQAKVVYADPVSPPHHSAFRNASSRSAKKVINLLSGAADATQFQSYRMILGEIARSIAAYSGSGVYLDVALGWVVGRAATAPVELRPEGDDRTSSYSLRRLLSHFLRMVLTGGTRGLRIVSLLGVIFALGGLALAVVIIIDQLINPNGVQGWSSTIVVLLISSGALLFSLGVVAEYIGVTVNAALGKPLYLLTQDPAEGPLGRDRQS